MFRGKWFVLPASAILLALIAAAISMLARMPARTPKTQIPAQTIPTPVAEITLSGKIRAENVINVAAPVEGFVGAFFAEVGQEVFEGQLLARITNEGLAPGQEMAEKTLAAAQSRVNSLESEIITARLEASRARADASRAHGEYDRLDRAHRRQQMLFAEGATPRLSYEKSSQEFDLAKSDYENRERVATEAESHVNELMRSHDSGKRTVDEKSAELENAKAKSNAAEVVAPAPGMVVARHGEVGQPIGPDQVDFFQIATQLSQLEITLDPDPPTMRRIRPGQPALVTLPDQGLDGALGAVKTIVGAQVIVAFTSSSPAVKPGMLAQVRIKVN